MPTRCFQFTLSDEATWWSDRPPPSGRWQGDRTHSDKDIQRFKTQLRAIMAEGDPVEYGIKCVRHDDPAAVILAAARHVDLVILRSMRRRTAGGLAVSDVTHQVIDTLTCSVVLFGEPHS